MSVDMVAIYNDSYSDQHGGILYKDNGTVIIDIPSSLSCPPGLTRFSWPILKIPYKVSDPKSGIPFDQGLLDLHEQLQETISRSCEILTKCKISLYLPRLTQESIQSITSEGGTANAIVRQDTEPDFQTFSENLSTVGKLVAPAMEPIYLEDAVDDQGTHSLSLLDINNTIVVNLSSDSWKALKVLLGHDTPSNFLIPPKSSFLQSTFLDCIPIVNKYSQSQELPGFDLILLDPPWHNKSVRRTKNTYHTSKFRPNDLYKLNLGLAESQDEDDTESGLLRKQGIIAVWITNNTKLRTFLIDMFAYWGLEFIGEWIWVKITEKGEPIFDIESISRKPYELLLLARRSVKHEGRDQDKGNNTLRERKVIFACPELHSRKPCIKAIIEPFLTCITSKNVAPNCCEMFARNLTEGWLSVGNEVLKGNWDGCWQINGTSA